MITLFLRTYSLHFKELEKIEFNHQRKCKIDFRTIFVFSIRFLNFFIKNLFYNFYNFFLYIFFIETRVKRPYFLIKPFRLLSSSCILFYTRFSTNFIFRCLITIMPYNFCIRETLLNLSSVKTFPSQQIHDKHQKQR